MVRYATPPGRFGYKRVWYSGFISPEDGVWIDGWWAYHPIPDCPRGESHWRWCSITEVWYQKICSLFHSRSLKSLVVGKRLSLFENRMELDDLSGIYSALLSRIGSGTVQEVVTSLVDDKLI